MASVMSQWFPGAVCLCPVLPSVGLCVCMSRTLPGFCKPAAHQSHKACHPLTNHLYRISTSSSPIHRQIVAAATTVVTHSSAAPSDISLSHIIVFCLVSKLPYSPVCFPAGFHFPPLSAQLPTLPLCHSQDFVLPFASPSPSINSTSCQQFLCLCPALGSHFNGGNKQSQNGTASVICVILRVSKNE